MQVRQTLACLQGLNATEPSLERGGLLLQRLQLGLATGQLGLSIVFLVDGLFSF